MVLAAELAMSGGPPSGVDVEFAPSPGRFPRRAGQSLDRSAANRLEQLLFRRYQQDGDILARRELVERYLPLARSLARRYERRGESLDDLVQVANLGLVKAIARFDPEREISFSSYAVPTILGELRRYVRDSGWALHVPRRMQERVLNVNRVVERLSGQLGRSPSPQQVADELQLPVEEVLEAVAANAAFETASLDTPLPSSDGERQTIAETFGSHDERFELIEDRASIGPALMALPERERLILHLRFVDDLTQSEIAERIGISQMHVSRLIRKALEKVQANTAEAA
jgi:RNA polymerase sigma-B factor